MKKPPKQTSIKGDIGKVLVDLSKLVFGGIFLGGILRGELPDIILITGGFVMVMALCVFGLLLGIKEE